MLDRFEPAEYFRQQARNFDRKIFGEPQETQSHISLKKLENFVNELNILLTKSSLETQKNVVN
uniref:Uncharacterized protein n=1 Tax=Romanomermis culicivorax TaxID=13658 RepID=A0A915IC22_ROMCU